MEAPQSLALSALYFLHSNVKVVRKLMPIEFIQGNHWLEPLVPSGGYPADILALADELPYLAGKLEGSIPPETAKRIGHLMRSSPRMAGSERQDPAWPGHSEGALIRRVPSIAGRDAGRGIGIERLLRQGEFA